MRPTVLAVLALTACASAPVARTARTGTSVRAPLAATWAAAVATIAEVPLTITASDRAAGVLAVAPVEVPVGTVGVADCGRALGQPIPPRQVAYTLLVRGDSTASVVTLAARYTHPNATTGVADVCVSTGEAERAIEQRIKQRAEPA